MFSQGSRVDTSFDPSASDSSQLWLKAFGQPGDSGSPVFEIGSDGSILGLLGIYTGKWQRTQPNLGVCQTFKELVTKGVVFSKN